jgi:hypothetical protein
MQHIATRHRGLWRTRAESVSARQAVRRLPAAAARSSLSMGAAAAHEATADGSASLPRAAVDHVFHPYLETRNVSSLRVY